MCQLILRGRMWTGTQLEEVFKVCLSVWLWLNVKIIIVYYEILLLFYELFGLSFLRLLFFSI